MDNEFRNKVRKTAEEHNAKVYAPSGAIVGLDGIKAASIGKISEASLTTRKAPKSLGREVEEEEVLFEGKASEAVEKFPVNINVAASLSIACNMDIDVKIIVELTKIRGGGMGRSVERPHLSPGVCGAPSSPSGIALLPFIVLLCKPNGASVLSTASSPLPPNSAWHIGCWMDG